MVVALFKVLLTYIYGRGGESINVASVGHALATHHAHPYNIYVNQWPGGEGGTLFGSRVLNVEDTYLGTCRQYKRKADIVYTVFVPNMFNLSAAARDHRTRKYWDSNPSNSNIETNCSYAVYDILRRGGVKIFGAPVSPLDLRSQLYQLSIFGDSVIKK